ncbi:sulfite exporter TauE/SafE family protein [Penaeicola halotolerans]|uniref:sulfite exporter TauE/SafE family protein n=1 Tax=Penaeicola halotolerans TaxID=2793196 RepID=UPI001CF8BAC0|nr:sulfite exporter TauE/SafE family protein [Penaeicola halotolerans]
MIDILVLVLAGLIGGFLAGLLGIGGGMIYILILPVALTKAGVPQEELVQYVIANSTLGTFFASVSGIATHIKTKTFYLRETVFVGVAGALTSLLMLTFVVNTPFYNRLIFNVVVVVFLILILLQGYLNRKKPIQTNDYQVSKLGMSLSGFLGGGMSALSGLGGGTIIVPLLSNYFKVDIKKAKSISIGMILIATGSMAVFNFFESPRLPYEGAHVGYMILSISLPMVVGVLISSPFGVKSSLRMSSTMLQRIFTTFVLLVIVQKIVEIFS